MFPSEVSSRSTRRDVGIMDLLTGLLALKHIAKLDGDRPHSYFFLRTQPFSSRFHLHINASRFLL